MVDHGHECPGVVGCRSPRHTQNKIREVPATVKADCKRRTGGAEHREIAEHDGIAARRRDHRLAMLTASLPKRESVELRGVRYTYISVRCGYAEHARVVLLAFVFRNREGEPVSR